MKTCNKCHENKDESEFRVRTRKTKSGTSTSLYGHCRQCQREYVNGHYIKNKPYYINKAKKSQKSYKIFVYNMLFKYTFDRRGCEMCGETDNRCLQFDHIDQDKKFEAISTMVSKHRSIETIIEEVSKCRILCANCHAKHTAEQQGWYKVLSEED